MSSDKLSWLQRIFSLNINRNKTVPFPIASGLYHVQREYDGMYSRLHLRVEPDGAGMLLANSAIAAQLSPSGVLIAKGMMDGISEEQIVATMQQYFGNIAKDIIYDDIQRVHRLMTQRTMPNDAHPVINQNNTYSVREAQLIAPLKADIPMDRQNKQNLFRIIDRLWEVGIPNVNFLVGDILKPDVLIHAIEHAEDVGIITGVRCRATEMSRHNMIIRLAHAGVDYITVVYASNNAATHEALTLPGDHAAAEKLFQEIQCQEVCVEAEIPLLELTIDGLHNTLEHLNALHVTNVSCYAVVSKKPSVPDVLHAKSMPHVATMIEDISHMGTVRFVWQPPVEYNPQDSLQQHVLAGPRCSGDATVRIEADGAVIPPRGLPVSAGNVLHDPWDTIWQHDAFTIYRERVDNPTRCDMCPGLTICARDCPQNPDGWSLHAENTHDDSAQ